MAYATQAELEARLQRALTAPFATAILDDASAIVDAYVGGSLMAATVVDRLPGVGTTHLFLPGPVTTAVSAVQMSGDAAALSGGVWVLRSAENRLERLDGSTWAVLDGETVIVSRTRGFSAGSIPLRLVGIVCALAGRLAEGNAAGLVRRTLGDHTEQWATPADNPGALHTLLEDELRDLDKWAFYAGEPTG